MSQPEVLDQTSPMVVTFMTTEHGGSTASAQFYFDAARRLPGYLSPP